MENPHEEQQNALMARIVMNVVCFLNFIFLFIFKLGKIE